MVFRRRSSTERGAERRGLGTLRRFLMIVTALALSFGWLMVGQDAMPAFAGDTGYQVASTWVDSTGSASLHWSISCPNVCGGEGESFAYTGYGQAWPDYNPPDKYWVGNSTITWAGCVGSGTSLASCGVNFEDNDFTPYKCYYSRIDANGYGGTWLDGGFLGTQGSSQCP